MGPSTETGSAIGEAAAVLAALPSVKKVTVEPGRKGGLARCSIVDRTGRRHRFQALELRGALGVASLTRIERLAGIDPTPPVVVVAETIGPKVAAELLKRGIGYVDAAGNCHVEFAGGQVVMHVEGRRRTAPRPRTGSLRAPGYRVLFALLAAPDLSRLTVRELESDAGSSRHAAAQLLAKLRDAGALLRLGRSGYAWAPGKRAAYVDRFVAGWADVLRDRQRLGRFRLREQEPEAIAKAVEKALKGSTGWGFGGGAAAMRMTGYFRGDETAVHVRQWHASLAAKLGAVPDRNGPLIVLQTMGELDLVSPVAGTAHPLLVHAELARSLDPRALDAAREVYEAFLQETGS